ncbi:hypothetical protein [Paenarthrobacter sp. A20]|uniref:hypothetical protein n=1 Tax=Paenarthrobacter sp. A20 TaxID=2817891 RepID=UPI00209E9291|nr:hypothetical protein [Paenarthrobacter sp. A20]MCP1411426.1 hypothetical protein [Paenarthrobacter sp. A20]
MSSNEVDLLKWPDPLPGSWTAVVSPAADAEVTRYAVFDDGRPAGTVAVEFVVATPLAASYPVSARDRLVTPDAGAGAEALQLVSERILQMDPACRRLVRAVDEGDIAAIALGEAAGYRYVVDVDIPGRSLALLAAEPGWVMEASRYLDDVPTK